MADDLPDAPWLTGGGGNSLPDAPWVTGGGPETWSPEVARQKMETGQRSGLGRLTGLPLLTPQELGQAPERPANYSETLRQFDKEADEQIKRGWETLTRERKPTRWFRNPFEGLSAYSDIAGGLVQGAIAPATAAFRNYVSVPVEQATGLPAEGLESGIMAAGARGPSGGAGLLKPRPTPAPALSPEDLAARTARGNPLSIPGTLQRPPVVDMGELERNITQPAPAAAAGEAAPTSRDNLGNVRLLPPEVPHDLAPRGRTSAGAAAAEADPLAEFSEPTIARAREVLAENGLNNPHMLEGALEEVSPHHTLAELSPGMEQDLARLSAADRGEARNLVTQTYRQRAIEARERMGAAFDRVFGPAENAAQVRRDIEAGRSEAAAPLWRAFTRTPIPPTDALRSLMPRLEASGALRAANKAMREEGLPIQNTFESRVAGEFPGEMETEVERVPTAAAFQYAKEHLDAQIKRALAEPNGAGRKDAWRYTQIKDALVSAIDNHPDPNVAGLWREARRVWQEPTELIEARRLGQRILTNNVDREDLPFLIQGWSPERLRGLEIGMRSYLQSLEVANRNPARTSNRLMDAILSPGNEEKLRAVLGDERTDQLISAIRHEETMHGAAQRIYGGSPTAGRLAGENPYLPKEGTLDQLSLEHLAHPGKAIGKGLAKVGLNKLAKQREAASTRLREEMARLMTSQGAERDAIARALIGADQPQGGGWSSGLAGRENAAINRHYEPTRGGRPAAAASADERHNVAQRGEIFDVARGAPQAGVQSPNLRGNAPGAGGGERPRNVGEGNPAADQRGVGEDEPPQRASGGRVNPTNIDPSPSEAQKEAGNYAKDHISIHGLDIAIENAKGGKREGVDRDGKKWSVKMPAHYGYIKRTTGKDGDHVDVYLGPHLKSPRVYVVDQVDADSRKFDEHKVFLGFANEAEVRSTYRRAFSDGRGNDRLDHLTELPIDEFKDWLANGDTMKPMKQASGGRIPGELPASQKSSHEEVGYVSVSPRSKQRCSLCTKFIPAVEGGPACKKVAQPILPGGWCKRFVRKPD